MEDRETIENTKCEIVKEVREIRHKISARFDHDVGRMVAHFQEMQEGYAGLGALQASAQTYREGIALLGY